MEFIHDNLVVKVLYGQKIISKTKLTKIQNHKYPNILEYITNRYVDSRSLVESINRMKYGGLEVAPKCPICGKLTIYKTKNIYTTYCSHECAYKSKNVHEKRKQTFIEHYGVSHPMKCKSVQEKVKNTNKDRYGTGTFAQSEQGKEWFKENKDLLVQKTKEGINKKYGVDSYQQSEEYRLKKDDIIEKMRNTNLQRFGEISYAKTDEWKEKFQSKKNSMLEKMKSTCLEKYGVDYSFQSEEVKQKIKDTCLKKYGVEYSFQSEEVKQKIKNTWLKKYGTEYPIQTKKIQEKSKQTCLKKYGVPYYSLTDEYKEKVKQTCLEKYGVEYSGQSTKLKEKIRQTCLDRYGVEYIFQSPVMREKSKQTCLEKYGVEYSSQSKEVQEKVKKTCLNKYGNEHYTRSEHYKDNISIIVDKIRQTKIKNHTFGTSKPEEELYLYIKEKFPDAVRQYKCDRYPYNCDFYIPELDLFLELNGFITHGKHAYNPDSIEDQEILQEWKTRYEDEKHPLYGAMINVWTVSDVKKRETAKQNNLNFKEVWSLDEGKEFIDGLR